MTSWQKKIKPIYDEHLDVWLSQAHCQKSEIKTRTLKNKKKQKFVMVDNYLVNLPYHLQNMRVFSSWYRYEWAKEEEKAEATEG